MYCLVQQNRRIKQKQFKYHIFLHLGFKSVSMHILAFVFCRIVFSTRGKITLLSVLFIKETFIWTATTVVSDGSSPSMAPSAAVLCPSMSFGGWQAVATRNTDRDQWKASVTTFTREKSVLVSTLETVLDLETLTVTQAGIQCPAWSLKKSHGPSNKADRQQLMC